MCLLISTVLCFFKDIRVDAMHNPLRKKRIRVDAMSSSLLREINKLRSRCHALKLTKIKYQVMNCNIGIVNLN